MNSKIALTRKFWIILMAVVLLTSAISGCGGVKQPKWDMQDLNTASNGNPDKALFLIANSPFEEMTKDAESPSVAELTKDPRPFYGKIVAFEGKVLYAAEVPKTEEMMDTFEGKEYEGKGISMIYFETNDKLQFNYIFLDPVDGVKEGSRMKAYGYPVGLEYGYKGEGPGVLSVVGNKIETFD